MKCPGDRLRAFAARWCCPGTMSRVIEPLIADLPLEHAQAVRSGRVWKGRAIHAAGWVAFLKVLAICAWTDSISLRQGWTADDRKALPRVHLAHPRGAFAVAAGVCAFCVVHLVRWLLPAMGAGIAACAAFLGYDMLLYGMRSLVWNRTLSPYAAAWIPSLVTLLVAAGPVVFNLRQREHNFF